MRNNQLKGKWVKPKLIVLVRGKQSEGVLLICKTPHNSLGPADDRTNCTRVYEERGYLNVEGCETVATS